MCRQACDLNRIRGLTQQRSNAALPTDAAEEVGATTKSCPSRGQDRHPDRGQASPGRGRRAQSAPQEDVLRWAAIAEVGSDHPLGRPIIETAEKAGPVPPP